MRKRERKDRQTQTLLALSALSSMALKIPDHTSVRFFDSLAALSPIICFPKTYVAGRRHTFNDSLFRDNEGRNGDNVRKVYCKMPAEFL